MELVQDFILGPEELQPSFDDVVCTMAMRTRFMSDLTSVAASLILCFHKENPKQEGQEGTTQDPHRR